MAIDAADVFIQVEIKDRVDDPEVPLNAAHAAWAVYGASLDVGTANGAEAAIKVDTLVSGRRDI